MEMKLTMVGELVRRLVRWNTTWKLPESSPDFTATALDRGKAKGERRDPSRGHPDRVFTLLMQLL